MSLTAAEKGRVMEMSDIAKAGAGHSQGAAGAPEPQDIEDALRQEVQKLLAAGEVEYVIGWTGADGGGGAAGDNRPLFVRDAGDAGKLVWDPLCICNLSTYLLQDRYSPGRIGIVAKGCDGRGLVRILADNQFPRENLVIIAIACNGVVDIGKLSAAWFQAAGTELAARSTVEILAGEVVVSQDGESHRFPREDVLLEKCLRCRYPVSPVSDIVIGCASAGEGEIRPEEKWQDVDAIESMSPAERNTYWNRQFSRCIRCYACRNVCPACNCLECIFDMDYPQWIQKKNTLSENQMYHIIRAFHVAGRCVDCGECERVCPVDIPLQKLNHKLEKEVYNLFGVQDPGTDLDEVPPLSDYREKDPDEFV